MMLLKPLPAISDNSVELLDRWTSTRSGCPDCGCSPTLGPLFATAPYLFDLAQKNTEWLGHST